MSYVFLSHVEEDASLTIDLASGLEKSGFKTWYYERDSIPGVSYLLQTGSAIERSSAVLLMVSRNSLGSHQITKEVVRGHEAGRPFVPVLVDVSHVEFQKRQPEWREAVGAAASIRMEPGGLETVISRVCQGLSALGMTPSEAPKSEPLSTARVSSVAAGAKEEIPHGPVEVGTTGHATDGSWAVNLGFGFAFYVNCSGSSNLRPAQYSEIAQLVAEPSQELGLDVSLPPQDAYSTESALALGRDLAAQLRVRSTRLASVFEFVWQVLLLLFGSDDGQGHPDSERSVLESTLTRAARNAALLDHDSQQIVHSLAWEQLTPARKQQEQDRFVAWAHSKMSAANPEHA